MNGYDDPPILAGAGTIGCEIIDDVPGIDVVVVPVGGAGLIAGMSLQFADLQLYRSVGDICLTLELIWLSFFWLLGNDESMTRLLGKALAVQSKP